MSTTPQAPPLEPVLSGLQASILFRRDPIAVLERVAATGDVGLFRLGPVDVYVLNHPDLVRELLARHHRVIRKDPTLQAARWLLGDGLLTSEGEFHRRQRALLNPAFHHHRIAVYGDAVAEFAVSRAEGWPAGEQLDVFDELHHITLEVVTNLLLGSQLGPEDLRLLWAQGRMNAIQLASPAVALSGAGAEAPPEEAGPFALYRAQIDSVIDTMVESRRRRGIHEGDLLSLLLRAQDEGAMTDLQVRDEVVTILVAGHETMTSALTWSLMALADHPQAEEQLHAEVDAALGDDLPRTGHLPDLPYTRAVLSESMRLYPPVWSMGRVPVEDVELGGRRIPRGSILLASQWLVHRDPRWWPEPTAFRPERWLGGQTARPRGAYLPFGAGRRICIGEGFAWMEGVLLLATLARRWAFRAVPGHRVVLFPSLTLRPRGGLPMVAVRRGTGATR